MLDFPSSFALVIPELILTGAGLVLLLVAAWVGDKAARAASILAAAALFTAGLFTIPGLHFGVDGPADVTISNANGTFVLENGSTTATPHRS